MRSGWKKRYRQLTTYKAIAVKKILLIISLLSGCFLFVVGQRTKAYSTAFPKNMGNYNCIYKAKYKSSDRKKNYPFNITDSIKLISFRYHKNNYPVTNNSLVTDSIVEVKILSKSGVDSLTDILYNNFYKLRPNVEVMAQCFLPRNGIVFIDKKGIIKAYSLICFHCGTHQESSDKVNFGDNCNQKMEKLRQFFIARGLYFGTDKEIQEYPGEGPDEIIAVPKN
jgi:hypothetical protein